MANWTDVFGTGAPTAATARATLGLAGVGKNRIINGDFDIWQRGVSFAPTTSGMYTADRWFVKPAGATLTYAAQGTNGPANTKYTLVLRGATSVTTVDVIQRVEAANACKLKKNCTLSFSILGNTGANFAPTVLINTANASDNFSAVTNRISSAREDNTEDSWTNYSVTLDLNQTNLENGFEVVIRIPSGSLDADTKYVSFSKIQLEEGSVATEFEARDIGTEMMLCEWYCKQIVLLANTAFIIGYMLSGSSLVSTIEFGRMRAAPTAAYSGGTITYATDSSNFTLKAPTISSVSFSIDIAADGVKYAYPASTNGVITLTAEL